MAIALSDNEVVGVASWTPGAIHELNTLYVADGSRGTGLAARLLDASIADRAAALWVFAGNTRALRFYAKHGFRAVGDHRVDAGTGVEEVRLSREEMLSPRAHV